MDRLMPRQRECLVLAALGLRNRQIATTLGIREGTVKTYMRGAYDRLGARNRTEAVVMLLKSERGR